MRVGGMIAELKRTRTPSGRERCITALVCGGLATGMAALASAAHADVAGGPQTSGTPPSVQLQTLQLQPNVYLIAGAGANIVVQTGPDGTLLVNAGFAAAADQVLAAIKPITDQPIRFIIDTSADPDVVGGNAALRKAGRSIYWTGPMPFNGGSKRLADSTDNYAADILAESVVLTTMAAPTGQVSPYPSIAWPSIGIETAHFGIYFNHEGIEIYAAAAEDATGSIVVLKRSDVIAAGGAIDADHFPRIDPEKGGSIQGEIDTLNQILELSDRPVPFVGENGGTLIVPGYGRVYQMEDVLNYRDMIVIIRDIIQNMVARKMTLQQIEAASPCEAFQREYGSDVGAWTTNDFVRAVYQSLIKENSERKSK